MQNGCGAVPGPLDVWLVLRGIKTLGVRMKAQEEAARKISAALLENKHVEAVYYPGLAGHRGKEIHDAQSSGAGAVFSFKTKTKEQAAAFLRRVKYAAAAVSLGGVETIASYPVKMSHAAIPPAERERLGITDTLIRISCGLEDPDDLVEDFQEALEEA